MYKVLVVCITALLITSCSLRSYKLNKYSGNNSYTVFLLVEITSIPREFPHDSLKYLSETILKDIDTMKNNLIAFEYNIVSIYKNKFEEGRLGLNSTEWYTKQNTGLTSKIPRQLLNRKYKKGDRVLLEASFYFHDWQNSLIYFGPNYSIKGIRKYLKSI